MEHARDARVAGRACLDCHSNLTEWPWYTNVAPVSWLTTARCRRTAARSSNSPNGSAPRRPTCRRSSTRSAARTCRRLRYRLVHSDARLSDHRTAGTRARPRGELEERAPPGAPQTVSDQRMHMPSASLEPDAPGRVSAMRGAWRYIHSQRRVARRERDGPSGVSESGGSRPAATRCQAGEPLEGIWAMEGPGSRSPYRPTGAVASASAISPRAARRHPGECEAPGQERALRRLPLAAELSDAEEIVDRRDATRRDDGDARQEDLSEQGKVGAREGAVPSRARHEQPVHSGLRAARGERGGGRSPSLWSSPSTVTSPSRTSIATTSAGRSGEPPQRERWGRGRPCRPSPCRHPRRAPPRSTRASGTHRRPGVGRPPAVATLATRSSVGVPVNAPSRSTRCRRRAPSPRKRRVSSTGSPPSIVTASRRPCDSRTTRPSSTSIAGRTSNRRLPSSVSCSCVSTLSCYHVQHA